jgi:hypothetical protein
MTQCDTTLLSLTGEAVDEAALRKFEASLVGEVIRPNTERYELARRLWIGMIDPRRPRFDRAVRRGHRRHTLRRFLP